MDQQHSMTFGNWKPVLVLSSIALLGLFATGTLPLAGIAQKADKSTPDSQCSLASGGDDFKALWFLMDTDKDGKISKREFMSFMEAEFDRLDKDKSGELDAKEFTQNQVCVFRPGTGK
jgi:hypothetical protein